MKIEFTKMNGLGNDFVIVDAREKTVNLNHDQKVKIADRYTGVGCDQLIVLEPSEKADVFMRIYNPDGSEAQACGNAARCVAAMLLTNIREQMNIQTIERVLLCQLSENNEVSVNMGKALSYKKVDLGNEYAELGQAISVNVGNPHCIFIVPYAGSIDLKYWGPKIEKHPLFLERTNVEFVSRLPYEHPFKLYEYFSARVWERGAGITKACGSGAVAIAWTLYKEGLIKNHLSLRMDGGTIELFVNDEDETILMTGATENNFKGEIEL